MGKNIEPTVKLTSAMRERVRVGESARDSVPLESHAELATGDDRPDPVGLLLAQDEHRLASLVPIRHARMRVTPFTFYRGGAAIMASDLSRGPSTDLRVQLCGDAHLSNFGVFNGADRRLVFDINDFDETSPGPFEWISNASWQASRSPVVTTISRPSRSARRAGR